MAFFEVVGDFLDALVGNLADVQQTVFAGQHVDECAKVQNLDNGAFVDFADFDFGCDFFDAAACFGGFVCVVACNGDGAVFGDVDLCACFFGQGADGCAAFADNVTDFFGVDFHAVQTWCKLRHFCFGFAHGFLHFAQNVHTRFFGLSQCNLHDFFGDALDFDVHLQGGNAVGCASYLEVHIAQVVFVAQNIGEHGKAVVFFNQTHGNASNVCFHGHASIHQAQAAAADRSHGGRTIGLGNFADYAHGVGELVFAGQYGGKGAFGQASMADFAALGAAHAAYFACSEGGHVVVQHKAVFVFASQRVDALCVALCAKCGYNQRLRFATGKQYRAVGAGQHAVADFDGAHGAGIAPVNAGLASQNLAANDARLDFKQQVFNFDFVKLNALCAQCFFNGYIGFAAGLGTCLLAADLVGSTQFVFGQCGDLADEGFVFGGRLPVPHGFASFAHQLVDGVDGDCALLVAKHHSAQHDVFRELFGFGFDHEHGSFGASYDQIHFAVFALGLAWVKYVLAVDVAHACGTNGTVKGDARDRQGGTYANHGGNVSVHFGVEREGMHNHMHFVVEAFGEQGANGAVNQAAGECFQIAGLGFALEEVAWDFACGVGFFDVINSEWEEILPSFGVFGADYSCQHDGAFDIDDYSTAGLACDFTRFHHDGVLAPLEGFGDFVEYGHGVFP